MSQTKHFNVLWGVRRSGRYHSRRRAFYESVERWFSLAFLLLGAGSVAFLLRGNDVVVLASSAAVSVLAGLNLAFAFGPKASRHEQFVKDFSRIERQLTANSSDATVRRTTIAG